MRGNIDKEFSEVEEEETFEEDIDELGLDD